MKILVIHGAGMNMRGKVNLETFGTMTLPEYDVKIKEYAKELDIEVEIIQSNNEGDIVDKLYEEHDNNYDAALINPSGYTTSDGPLRAAITHVGFPTIEVHISNPSARGTVSKIQQVCKGSVYGFGIYGYYLAFNAVKNVLA
jgi:3-dehydroquinate dehydratase-2